MTCKYFFYNLTVKLPGKKFDIPVIYSYDPVFDSY